MVTWALPPARGRSGDSVDSEECTLRGIGIQGGGRVRVVRVLMRKRLSLVVEGKGRDRGKVMAGMRCLSWTIALLLVTGCAAAGGSSAPLLRSDGGLRGAVAGLNSSEQMKVLDHLRQHLARKEYEADVRRRRTHIPQAHEGTRMKKTPEILEFNPLDVNFPFPFEEERMVDLQDWLVSGGGLKDVDECNAAVRRQAAAEAASRRGTTNAIPAKDVPAKVIEKPKKWTQKLSDEVIRVISAAAENPEDEVTFTAPPKGVIGLVPDPDEQEGGVLAERLEELEEEMGRAVKELRFEDAAKIRDEMVQLKCPPATTRNCQEGDSMFDWEEDKSIPGLVQGFEWAQEGEDAGFDWVDAEKQKKAVATKVAVATRLGIGGGNKPSWTPPADMLPNDSFDGVMKSGRRSDARDAEIEMRLKEAVAAMKAAGKAALPVRECVDEVDGLVSRIIKTRNVAVSSSLHLVLSALDLVLNNPSDPTFRTVNLGSGSFVDATGGEEALAALVTKLFKACGFAAVGAADGGERLSMPLDYSLFLIREAKACVEIAVEEIREMPDGGGARRGHGGAVEASLSAEERRPRLVFSTSQDLGTSLPAVPEVAEDMYNLTPADLIKVLESNRKEIVKMETLSLRSRESQKASPSSVIAQSRFTVQFRLSDGCFIQARFHPLEPVSALFSFLSDSLVPGLPQFLLKTPPPVRELSAVDRDSLLSAGIVQSGLVNVGWSDGQRRGRDVAAPWLREMPLSAVPS